MDLENAIVALQERNKKVEAEKAWETSLERRILIALLTYIVVCSFFVITQTPNPFVSALVPTFWFLLSTVSLDFLKQKRMKKQLNNK